MLHDQRGPHRIGFWQCGLGRKTSAPRTEEALAEPENLEASAPEDAAVHLATAGSLRDLGRNARAVEAYRRFLAIFRAHRPLAVAQQAQVWLATCDRWGGWGRLRGTHAR